MNFFEHQDRARRKTGMLVWLFVVAVAGLIAGTYVLVMSLYLGGLEQAAQQREMLINQFEILTSKSFFIIKNKLSPIMQIVIWKCESHSSPSREDPVEVG